VSADSPAALNPLLPAVLQLLRAAPAGLSEYELLRRLDQAQQFPALAAEPDLALFQKHFLVMNALYRLQESLWREDRLHLQVTPLHIAIMAADPAASGQEVAADSSAALRDYYLDWRQLEQTDGVAVAQLLGAFWQRLRADDRREQALAALELGPDSTWAQIKAQYRRLAARAHPDRGGDRERFLAVRAAYEVLRLLRGGQ
jgi:hypothetical protein